jgi:hypothetical protein
MGSSEESVKLHLPDLSLLTPIAAADLLRLLILSLVIDHSGSVWRNVHQYPVDTFRIFHGILPNMKG